MKALVQEFLRSIARRFPVAATAYRIWRDCAQISDEPRDTPLGFKLVGSQAMQVGEFEPEETRIVTHLLSKVDVVINVGANVGYYCCLALGHGKYVIAFEPNHLNLKYLLRNIRVNGHESQIEIFPIALTDKVGIVELYGGGTGASLLKGWASTPDNYVNLVPCSTVDNALGNRLQGKRALMIVDIEGGEQSMLAGATYVLGMNPMPIWLVEISVSEHQPNGVRVNPKLVSTFQLFWNRGYESCTADGSFRNVELDELQDIVESEVDTLHTHNFLFFERGMRDEFFTRA